MTPDLAINSQTSGITLFGTDGSQNYIKVGEIAADTTLRRVQSTSSTYPRELTIIQQERNTGRRNATRRTVMSIKEKDWVTVVPLENGLGGKADGEATVTLTIVRPLGAGYTARYTSARMKELLCALLSLPIANADAILAGER